MHSSKLFTLIGGLETGEIRWLHKFLKSPFYNSNNKILRLFEYIKKYYPDLASPRFEKETTFRYLFPKQNFNPQKMRKLMHELATLVEDFLVAQHSKKNKFTYKKILTKEFGQRNLYDFFEKGTIEIVTELDNLPYRDKDFFLEKYLNDYQFFTHPSTNPQQNFIPRLFQMSDKLDEFYFLQKLQLNSVLESAKHIYKVEEDLPCYEPIIQEIKDRKLEEFPAFHLYLLVNQLFQSKDTNNSFEQLYEAFFGKKESLSEADRTVILKYLINFVVTRTNEGNEEYVKKGLNLYKFGLNENLLVTKNRITEMTFINIAWYGSFSKDFEFTSNFIENYQKYIDEKKRREIVLLSKAHLLFNSKEYNQVIDLLSTRSFSKILNKLRARALVVKSYLEIYLLDESYHGFMITQIENFERNLRREENISNIKKLSYLNFLKFFKRLIEIKTQKLSLIKFKKDLIETRKIANRAWLNSKAKLIADKTSINV